MRRVLSSLLPVFVGIVLAQACLAGGGGPPTQPVRHVVPSTLAVRRDQVVMVAVICSVQAAPIFTSIVCPDVAWIRV